MYVADATCNDHYDAYTFSGCDDCLHYFLRNDQHCQSKYWICVHDGVHSQRKSRFFMHLFHDTGTTDYATGYRLLRIYIEALVLVLFSRRCYARMC